MILEEETAFLKTLDKGVKILDRRIDELKKENKEICWKERLLLNFTILMDSLSILRSLSSGKKSMKLDMPGFEKAMKGQKNRSREDASVEAGDWKVIRDSEKTIFTGYENTEDEVRIARYRMVKIKGREVWQLVFDKTPFYAESGGQVGDTGYITDGTERIAIYDTIKENNPDNSSCRQTATGTRTVIQGSR